jgi:hypothetical protein
MPEGYQPETFARSIANGFLPFSRKYRNTGTSDTVSRWSWKTSRDISKSYSPIFILFLRGNLLVKPPKNLLYFKIKVQEAAHNFENKQRLFKVLSLFHQTIPILGNHNLV